MPRIAYEDWTPNERSLSIVRIANAICAEYAAQGYDLTLRQLYYQFVARGYIPNNQRSYKSLGVTVDRARRAGHMDWNYIVDRTRNLAGHYWYDSAAEHVEQIEADHHIDLWEGQEYRVEVWVEKEALAGVVARSALGRGLRYFSCRGYVSQSEMHAAAMRHVAYQRMGQSPIVIHLGDHDPSGIDMTRDVQERLELFGATTEVRRIALNFDQIEQYSPPPNPTKMTDSRAGGYLAKYGASSWELDALDPTQLADLITTEVDRWVDVPEYEARQAEQAEHREQLSAASRHWDAVVDLIAELDAE